MTIRLTRQEIVDRSKSYLEPIYIVCKNCGKIQIWYVFPTGVLPTCPHCMSCNEYEIAEVEE